MKETFEITLRYYPDDNLDNCVSIRRVVPRAELAFSTTDLRKLRFVEMTQRIDAAIASTPKKKGKNLCPCGLNQADCWYCEDAEYKASHSCKSQWKNL